MGRNVIAIGRIPWAQVGEKEFIREPEAMDRSFAFDNEFLSYG
jgi:hypothetical protein